MSKNLPLATGLSALNGLGLTATPGRTGDTSTTYADIDDSGDIDYLGVNEARDGGRVRRETRWTETSNPTSELIIGHTALAHVQATRNVPIIWDQATIHPTPAHRLASGWSGPGIDRFLTWADTYPTLTPRDQETLLIRLAVAAGVPIGNSAKAGMWDSWLGHPLDTAAQLLAIHAGLR